MRDAQYRWVSPAVAVLVMAGVLNAGEIKTHTWSNPPLLPLFDGKSLDGWEVRGGSAKYHVEDGAIVGTTVEGSPNTFLCTKREYGDFELEFEVKVDPPLNSGVQIRSHTYDKDTTVGVWRNGVEQPQEHRAGEVYGYQVEIASGTHSGSVWDEARRDMWLHDASGDPNASKAFRDGRWNKFRIICSGDLIRTSVNGVPCAEMRDPLDQRGFIGLQVHSYQGAEPAQVRWREIRIVDLDRQMGLRHVWRPLLDGKTLNGWHTLPGGKWEVRDGVLIGTNTSSDQRHGLLVSDGTFKDFTVQLKFKAVKGNSGLYLRAEEVNDVVGVNGLQAEIDASRDVGGLYETGGRAWVVQPSEHDVRTWFEPGRWNTMTVSAHGKWIVVHVNGRKTAEVHDDPGRIEGRLALQLHGGQDMEVHFRDIQMLLQESLAESDSSGR
jgi:hypothetical protein